MAKCGMATEVYSRVVGYFRPVQQWNKGKQEEFKDRTEFAIPGSLPAKKERKADDTESKLESDSNPSL